MKVMLIIRLPHETFNAAVQDGTAVSKTRAILDAVQPEAVYFTEMNGLRTLIMIAELENPSRVPALAEPWFLTFNADVEFHVVMTAEDLQQADIDDLGRKWG
jgi:hypothetical protein